MEYTPSIELKNFMFNFLSDEKIVRFNEVVNNRTRHFTMVLEDIYQGQNTNAVIRSCEVFGIQDIHIIENRYKFEVVEDISMGSSKWVDLYQYNQKENNTIDCITQLRSKGYRIIGTTPHKNDIGLHEVDITQKTAFILGSERDGMSEEAMKHCDGFMKIPMAGFTESLNLSNCSAIILQNLTDRVRRSNVHWQLSEEEKTAILINWCFEVTGRKNLLLEYFNTNNTSKSTGA
jgi:tRNA (guanosine-2'-O-)-methyltransferase